MGKKIYKEVVSMNSLLCLFVVMIHLTSAPVVALTKGSFVHMVIFAVNKLLCFCVPAFIFLSGFKLYSGYGDKKIDLKRFFIGRVKKIILPYLVSVLVYFIYFYSKKWVALSELPQYIFLGTLVAHFYYIIIAVQLYILFPLLKKLTKYPIVLLVLSLAITVCCHELFYFKYSDRFFGTYIFYFVFGMLFSKYDIFGKIKHYFLISAVGYAVMACVHFYFSYMATLGKRSYRYAEFVNIIYVFFSICLLYGICVLISRKSPPIYSMAGILGDVSYSVYLYHILIISVLQYDVYIFFNLTPMDQFAISFAVVYSLICIYAFSVWKIKSLRNAKAMLGKN